MIASARAGVPSYGWEVHLGGLVGTAVVLAITGTLYVVLN